MTGEFTNISIVYDTNIKHFGGFTEKQCLNVHISVHISTYMGDMLIFLCYFNLKASH